jgi:hypothetical protein
MPRGDTIWISKKKKNKQTNKHRTVAAETLSQLFYLPHSMVLGCSVTLPYKPVQQEITDEEQAMIELIRSFTSRHDWVDQIVATWKKAKDELPENVQRYGLMRAQPSFCVLMIPA